MGAMASCEKFCVKVLLFCIVQRVEGGGQGWAISGENVCTYFMEAPLYISIFISRNMKQ